MKSRTRLHNLILRSFVKESLIKEADDPDDLYTLSQKLERSAEERQQRDLPAGTVQPLESEAEFDVVDPDPEVMPEGLPRELPDELVGKLLSSPSQNSFYVIKDVVASSDAEYFTYSNGKLELYHKPGVGKSLKIPDKQTEIWTKTGRALLAVYDPEVSYVASDGTLATGGWIVGPPVGPGMSSKEAGAGEKEKKGRGAAGDKPLGTAGFQSATATRPGAWTTPSQFRIATSSEAGVNLPSASDSERAGFSQSIGLDKTGGKRREEVSPGALRGEETKGVGQTVVASGDGFEYLQTSSTGAKTPVSVRSSKAGYFDSGIGNILPDQFPTVGPEGPGNPFVGRRFSNTLGGHPHVMVVGFLPRFKGIRNGPILKHIQGQHSPDALPGESVKQIFQGESLTQAEIDFIKKYPQIMYFGGIQNKEALLDFMKSPEELSKVYFFIEVPQVGILQEPASQATFESFEASQSGRCVYEDLTDYQYDKSVASRTNDSKLQEFIAERFHACLVGQPDFLAGLSFTTQIIIAAIGFVVGRAAGATAISLLPELGPGSYIAGKVLGEKGVEVLTKVSVSMLVQWAFNAIGAIVDVYPYIVAGFYFNSKYESTKDEKYIDLVTACVVLFGANTALNVALPFGLSKLVGDDAPLAKTLKVLLGLMIASALAMLLLEIGVISKLVASKVQASIIAIRDSQADFDGDYKGNKTEAEKIVMKYNAGIVQGEGVDSLGLNYQFGTWR